MRGHNQGLSSLRYLALLCAACSTAVGHTAVLEEVVVTARKRAENLQDVPMAVQAFSTTQLQDYQISSITDLERLAPNVSLTETTGLAAGSVQVFVRGIGNDPGLDQGVGIYLDDVYLNRTAGALLEVYDIERIEVLKGPQGNLYGRNTIGGAIKYVTRSPGETPEASFELKAGAYDLRQFKGSLSGPLIDGSLYGSVGILERSRDGIQVNEADGESFNTSDFSAYRFGLLWTPRDDLRLFLNADYSRDQSMPYVPVRIAADGTTLSKIDFVTTGGGYLPGFPVLTQERNDASLPRDIDRINSEFGAGYRQFEVETRTASAKVEWDLNSEWMFKSISAARWVDYTQPFDFDGSDQAFITSITQREMRDLSQEFQLHYSSEQLKAVLGAYYLDGEENSAGITHQYPRLLATHYQIKDTLQDDRGVSSAALYANVDWDFAPQWQLSLGARYTEDRKSLEKVAEVEQGYYALAQFGFLGPRAVVAVQPGQEALAEAYPGFSNWAGASTFQILRFNEDIAKVSDRWSELSPSLKLSHFLNEDTLLYASLSSGFKAGGFETSGSDAPSYDPETVTTYALGWKATLLDGTLRLNGEWFYNDYSDKQLSVRTLVNNDLVSRTSNVGELSTQGAELELSWLPPVDGLSTGLNVGYLDTEISSYETTDKNSGQRVDIADTTAVGFAPRWTVQARLGYEQPLTEQLNLFLGTDVAYRSASYTNSPIDLTNPLQRLQQQQEHAIWNALVRVESADQRWYVALEGKNLENTRVMTSTFQVGPFVTAGFNQPRTWGLALGYQF